MEQLTIEPARLPATPCPWCRKLPAEHTAIRAYYPCGLVLQGTTQTVMQRCQKNEYHQMKAREMIANTRHEKSQND